MQAISQRQSQLSTRKGTPKSRVGCKTCKVRHVKCDETQPSCNRCANTGRICDGYEQKIVCSEWRSYIPSQRVPCTIPKDVPSSVRIDTDFQCDAFEFFRRFTCEDLDRFSGDLFWKRTVMQMAHQEPAVMNAIIALGALHMDAAGAKLLKPNSENKRGIAEPCTVRQYELALQSLRYLISHGGASSARAAMLGAIICLCFEVKSGNYIAALTHLESCIRVVEEVIDDQELVVAFSRLDIQASTSVGMRRPQFSWNKLAQSASLTHNFYDLRGSLEMCANKMYYFMRPGADDHRYRLLWTTIPDNFVRELEELKAMFRQWKSTFDSYCEKKHFDADSWGKLTYQAIELQYLFYKITLDNSLYPYELGYDRNMQEFNTIVQLSRDLISAKSQGTQLALQISYVLPLYLTAAKCRHHSTRLAALALLEGCDTVEGVWDSAIQASIARRVMDAEIEMTSRITGSSKNFIPEEARLHGVETSTTWKAGKATTLLSCSFKPNGVFTAWEEHVDRIEHAA